MPTLISRAEALQQISDARRGAPCLMCAIVERDAFEVHVLYEDADVLVSLPRYVRKWGQVTVTPKRHVTSYSEVDPRVWRRVNDLGHAAATMVERVRRPKRVILASTGSAAGELVNSSTHLHLHVIPLYDSDDRPADVFSWQSGIYVGTAHEWDVLKEEYGAYGEGFSGFASTTNGGSSLA